MYKKEKSNVTSKLLALEYMNYILSDEMDRITNPVVDQYKYKLYLYSIEKILYFSMKNKCNVSYTNPVFPTSYHLISLLFPTSNDEIGLPKDDIEIFNIISKADGFNMDTDLFGNIRFYFGFENIYKERSE